MQSEKPQGHKSALSYSTNTHAQPEGCGSAWVTWAQAGVPVLLGRSGGVDDDLAVLAHADTFGAYAGDILEGEVDDAALARGHGIQAKGLLGGLDAFGGNASGHAKLFKTESAIAAAIEV